MNSGDLTFIRRLPLFRNMTTAHFEEITQGLTEVEATEQTILIEQGAAADHLYIVVDGLIEMFAQWGGRECTMGVVRPVETFILAACIRDAPFLMSARALQPSRVLLLPAPDLRAIFRRDPEFAVSVIEELANDFRRVIRHAKGLKLRDTRQRIAAYLLDQSRLAQNADVFQLQVEKRHVASFLGMTPENLSRGLRALAQTGVKVKGNTVTIHDRASLVGFVKPDILMDGPDFPGSSSGVGLPGPSHDGAWPPT
ncbi:cyclic nucleotide-binding domain-containing protein [Thalassovita sp.]|uniref:cyclic nucleotide-binding domain-containing protein n=1 Tax=Thalassovita sp. TaxID=1979401 RepID=UPI0029DE8FE7|nr:cyclic nucleotide-binding domain-containing protein [Thalassovita sp.]